MSSLRLDLSAIKTSLLAFQRDFDQINPILETPRDPFGEDVLESLLSGYRFLDQLQAQESNLLVQGSSRLILQLNCAVICERPALSSDQCAPHFRVTERRFYDDTNPGGVRAFMNYLADHKRQRGARLAAGVYAQVLSEPQLFFEGNHRTGTLLMSHALLLNGQPPFVLSRGNAKTYLDLSSSIKGLRKGSLKSGLARSRLQARLADLLEESADPRHLLPVPDASPDQSKV